MKRNDGECPELIGICGMSGSGKGTLTKELLKTQGEGRPFLMQPPSYTTRNPRPGEENSGQYVFVKPEEFDDFRHRGELLTDLSLHGNWYGYTYAVVEGLLNHGVVPVLDLKIDTLSAIWDRYKGKRIVSVFLITSTRDVLTSFHNGRAGTQPDEMQMRLSMAGEELAKAWEWDVPIVVNEAHQLDLTVEAVKRALGLV